MKHWPIFAEFCRQELATGGPDPQIETLRQLAKGSSLEQRVWLIGCYGSHHCVPSAFSVWRAWTPEQVIARPKAFRRWLEEHWDSLPVRPEMRSHRMPEKRVKCLTDFAEFAQWYRPSRYDTYDAAWHDSQKRIKYFGRYMAIKVLEMLSRFGDSPTLQLKDMRAKGGWSPRRCLALVWDKDAHPSIIDRKDESPETLARVEALFKKTRITLRDEHQVKVSCFQLQVLLCEYKEALAGGYYPGASLDEELMYIAAARVKGRELRTIFAARKSAFRRRHLGEIGGWNGTRPDHFTPFKVSRDLR